MTQNEIIEMAKQAGIDAEADTLCRYKGWVEPLEAFAKLVAAKEREACAKLCIELDDLGGEYFAEAIRARGEA
jgi:hypothetical protein